MFGFGVVECARVAKPADEWRSLGNTFLESSVYRRGVPSRRFRRQGSSRAEEVAIHGGTRCW